MIDVDVETRHLSGILPQMIRITAGEHRGRQLKVPRGTPTRPMSARAREGVMNHLSEKIQDAAVWDIYAGSGILGFECLSRGAKSLVAVDKNEKAFNAIRETAETLGWKKLVQVLRVDVHRIPMLEPPLPHPDLLFFDPPYSNFEEQGPVRTKVWRLFTVLAEKLNRGGCAVVHTPGPILTEEELSDLPGIECREYGSTALWWWHKEL